MTLDQAGRRIGSYLRRTADRLRWAVTSRRRLRRTALSVPADRQAPASLGRLGARSILQAPTRIQGARGIEIDDDVTILAGSGIDVAPGARFVVGHDVRIGPELEVVCTTGVTIGPRSVLGSRVAITDAWSTLRSAGDAPGPLPTAVVEIEADVTIGTGAIIGPGVHIGAGATIAEGAVVLEDVVPGAHALGNPSRVGTVR